MISSILRVDIRVTVEKIMDDSAIRALIKSNFKEQNIALMSDKLESHHFIISLNKLLICCFCFFFYWTSWSQKSIGIRRTEVKKLLDEDKFLEASQKINNIKKENLNSTNLKLYFNLIMSDYFSATNRPDSAGRYLQLSKRFILPETPDSLKAFVDFELGNWYAKIHDYSNSYKHYQSAVRLFDISNDMESYIKASGNFGIISFIQGDTTEALTIFQHILKRSEKKGDKLNCAIVHQNLGRFFLNIGKIDSAKYHFNSSVKIVVENKSIGYLPNAYRGLGEIAVLENEYPQAILYYEKAIALYKEMDNKSTMLDALVMLKDLHKKNGNLSKALQLSEQALVLKSEVYEDSRARSIGITQAELMDMEKDSKIKLLRTGLELEKTKSLLLFSAGIMILFTLVFVAVKWRDQRKKQALENISFAHKNKISILENEKLRNEIELAKKALTAESLRLIEKNDQIQLLRNKMNEVSKSLPDKYADEMNSLNSTFRSLLRVEHSWEEFLLYFKEVHPDAHRFFDSIKPTLTLKEKRLLSLIYLELNTKEISKITGISPDSVKKARTRLRKKLSLNENDSFREFVTSQIEL